MTPAAASAGSWASCSAAGSRHGRRRARPPARRPLGSWRGWTTTLTASRRAWTARLSRPWTGPAGPRSSRKYGRASRPPRSQPQRRARERAGARPTANGGGGAATLRTLYAEQKDVSGYVALAEATGLTAKDCGAVAKMLAARRRPGEALGLGRAWARARREGPAGVVARRRRPLVPEARAAREAGPGRRRARLRLGRVPRASEHV